VTIKANDKKGDKNIFLAILNPEEVTGEAKIRNK